jgi:endonuclease/exonuclease/phosphatase family metal-dependent hydrolase
MILSVIGPVLLDPSVARAAQFPRSQAIALVPNASGRFQFGGVLPTSGFPGGYSPSFTNISPESIRDAAQDPLAAGYDTVVLNGICDIADFLSNSQFKARLEGFASRGGKLIIWDSECSSTDYSNFALPFVTNNPGEAGASGTLSDAEENSLSSGDPTSPSYVDVEAVSRGTDAVGDANVFETFEGGWFFDLRARNVNGVNGPAQAYANLRGGLIIYSGLDKDFMGESSGFDPQSTSGSTHLNRIWLLELLQPWNPDGLPRGTPVVGATQRFIQFNMCGSEGSADPGKRNQRCNLNGVSDAVVRSIRDLQPTIVTLNEACRSQVEQIKTTLTTEESLSANDKGPWPMEFEFAATNTKKNRCSDRQFGNAVMVRGPLTKDPQSPYQLPNRPGEQELRNMVCVITSSQDIPIRACSTHLVNWSDSKSSNKDSKKAPKKDCQESKRNCNRAQLFEVARLANTWVAQGQAVVIGGDFNDTPDDMSNFEDEDTFGVLTTFLQQFSDVDDQARPTHSDGFFERKLDYVFLSIDHFSDISGFPTESNVSDHKLLRGTATFTG